MNNNQIYLEKKLNDLTRNKVIKAFKVRPGNADGDVLVLIDLYGSIIQLDTDFDTHIEMLVVGYFKCITDYVVGDYKYVLDWHLSLIEKLSAKDYEVKTYLRKNKIIAKYLSVGSGKDRVTLGDFKNHFTLFARKTIEKGAPLN